MDANGVGSEAETRKGGARRWSLRTAYALRQASRVAWFAAHGEVAEAREQLAAQAHMVVV